MLPHTHRAVVFPGDTLFFSSGPIPWKNDPTLRPPPEWALLPTFLFQDTAENDIKERLFEQERQQLLDANKAISQNIISDLDSILTKLKVITVSPYIQEGEDTQTWDKSEPLVQEMYDETKELVGKTDGMFLIDKSGIIRVNALKEE